MLLIAELIPEQYNVLFETWCAYKEPSFPRSDREIVAYVKIRCSSMYSYIFTFAFGTNTRLKR